MHDIIQNGLEEYLDGWIRRDFQAHLDECAECRTEVLSFQELSGMLTVLRTSEPIEPPPGFFFRVSERIEAETKPSFWSIFSLDAVFGRRVAFASVMTLAVVGAFLVSQEGNLTVPAPVTTDAIIASHDFLSPHDSASERDQMIVQLASYQH